MENEFDKKIKQSLENFEMPYDASSWAAFEKQLPAEPAIASNTGSSSLWKIGAVIGLTAIAVATWYLTKDGEELAKPSEEFVIEKSESNEVELSIEDTKVSDPKLSEQSDIPQVKEDAINSSARTVNADSEEFADVDEEILRFSDTQPTEQETRKKQNTEPEASISNTAVSAITSETNANPIIVDFIVSNITACVNQDVSFMNESKGTAESMIWDFGDGTTSSEKSPVHSFIAPGVYQVTLSASDKDKSVEKSIDIKVNPVPNPIVSAERKLNGYQAIPLYVFSTAIQPNENAIWSFSDGIRLTGTEANHLFREAGDHTAKLTVTNQFGCSTSVEEKFYTERFNLLAPTAFTPNGDGTNETFMPKAVVDMGIAFEMTIQNPKTGQVVYRTENADEPWNGTLNNSGVELEKGLYVWTVVLKENVCENRVFTETVHLKR